MNLTTAPCAWVWWVTLGASLSACGSATTVARDAGAPVDLAATDTAVDVVAERDVPPAPDAPTLDRPTDAGAPSACGESAPAAGSSCAREGLACQYGDDPRESCRTTATCTGGRWEVTAPRCPPITPPAMCPATRDVAAGMACTTLNAVCNYGGLSCTCTNCRSFPVGFCGGPLLWRCVAPNVTPGCPAVQPNLGGACPLDGQTCGYDCEAYGFQGGRSCARGAWQSSTNNCPISTRAAKRDIRYLTAAESSALAEEALRTRLATYEYTDPALRGPRRLGFIYEDPTTHPYARNPDISGVDLYGYTSLLLATVQRQQQQITALQHAVESLRGRPRPTH